MGTCCCCSRSVYPQTSVEWGIIGNPFDVFKIIVVSFDVRVVITIVYKHHQQLDRRVTILVENEKDRCELQQFLEAVNQVYTYTGEDVYATPVEKYFCSTLHPETYSGERLPGMRTIQRFVPSKFILEEEMNVTHGYMDVDNESVDFEPR